MSTSWGIGNVAEGNALNAPVLPAFRLGFKLRAHEKTIDTIEAQKAERQKCPNESAMGQ
jgi:hypothetical protein